MEGEARTASNARNCLRKVSDEHFVVVVKILGSLGVVPFNENTNIAVLGKHSFKPPHILSTPITAPPLTVDSKVVFQCLETFPMGTSCGRDDLRT